MASHIAKDDGYRPRLTPGNLKRNLSQGPIIHRPHRYRGAKSISNFSHLPLVQVPVYDYLPGWNRQTTVQPWVNNPASLKTRVLQKKVGAGGSRRRSHPVEQEVPVETAFVQKIGIKDVEQL
jgi:hypothetical protein